MQYRCLIKKVIIFYAFEALQLLYSSVSKWTGEGIVKKEAESMDIGGVGLNNVRTPFMADFRSDVSGPIQPYILHKAFILERLLQTLERDWVAAGAGRQHGTQGWLVTPTVGPLFGPVNKSKIFTLTW